MSSRKKSVPQGHQTNLGFWCEFWRPPKRLRVKDIFPHLTINEYGQLLVRGQIVTDHTIQRHWPKFRDLIEDEDRPRVYKRYKKAIDARQESGGR